MASRPRLDGPRLHPLRCACSDCPGAARASDAVILGVALWVFAVVLVGLFGPDILFSFLLN